MNQMQISNSHARNRDTFGLEPRRLKCQLQRRIGMAPEAEGHVTTQRRNSTNLAFFRARAPMSVCKGYVSATVIDIERFRNAVGEGGVRGGKQRGAAKGNHEKRCLQDIERQTTTCIFS